MYLNANIDLSLSLYQILWTGENHIRIFASKYFYNNKCNAVEYLQLCSLRRAINDYDQLKSIRIVIDRPHEPFPEKYRNCSNRTIDVNSRKLRIWKPYHTRYQLMVCVTVYAVISYLKK